MATIKITVKRSGTPIEGATVLGGGFYSATEVLALTNNTKLTTDVLGETTFNVESDYEDAINLKVDDGSGNKIGISGAEVAAGKSYTLDFADGSFTEDV